MGRLQDADWAFSVALSCTLRKGWNGRIACSATLRVLLWLGRSSRIQGAIGLSRLRFVGLSLPLLGSSFGLAPV